MKQKFNIAGRHIVIVLVAVIAAAAGWLLYMNYETGRPALRFSLPGPVIGASGEIGVTVSDAGTGLRSLWVGVRKDGGEHVLYAAEFPRESVFQGGRVSEKTVSVPFSPERLSMTDGAATLVGVVTDYSWKGFGKGNETRAETSVEIDMTPPRIHIISDAHNVSQGGSGLITYSLSEPCAETGVLVGDRFFPGYADRQNTALAFFALAYDHDPDTPLHVTAADPAGNTARAGFPHYIKRKKFRQDTLRISDGFLNRKMGEFNAPVPADSENPLLDEYLYVNRNLRRENYQTLTEILTKADTTFHWKGAFLRMPNAARMAAFADHRTYTYNGEKIDEQTHLGVDLASTAHAPVPAANAGRVVFAGTVGIYGKTVILDHGFGLYSMYSHLSAFSDVAVEGETVDKGDVIGRTGTSGLAGGDHLHFSMLVHHTFVNPVEWWDPAWIKNNIENKTANVRFVFDPHPRPADAGSG